MDRFDVAIAGAGASGLMAAISAARQGMKVVVVERMERAGRKVLITGKGRCNITNTKDWNEFSTHIYPNPGFFRFAFRSFTNLQVVKFFEEIGLSTKIERGDRVYPESGRSSDVVDIMLKEAARLGIVFIYKSRIIDLELVNNRVNSVIYENGTDIKRIYIGSLIVATGGLSYPSTGSTGDGYLLANKAGHKLSKRFPSLTALMPEKYDFDLKGLILKNIGLKLFVGKDCVQEEFGDAEFTNNGFEGPLGLRISRKAVCALIDGNKVSLKIDLKPAISNEQLINRIVREFGDSDTLTLKELLKKLLPQQLIPLFLNELRFGPSKILSRRLPGEIYAVSDLIKNWIIKIENFTGFERCVITAGGVELNEIFPKSMGSRIIENLYFAGEVIDLDGDTGGYNLQIAFSTGYLAGLSASHLIKKSSSLI
ncbi:MAG: aminoacetone oxidase family FAD-binding enzyme [Bacteroidales bacterium]